MAMHERQHQERVEGAASTPLACRIPLAHAAGTSPDAPTPRAATAVAVTARGDDRGTEQALPQAEEWLRRGVAREECDEPGRRVDLDGRVDGVGGGGG